MWIDNRTSKYSEEIIKVNQTKQINSIFEEEKTYDLAQIISDEWSEEKKINSFFEQNHMNTNLTSHIKRFVLWNQQVIDVIFVRIHTEKFSKNKKESQ